MQQASNFTRILFVAFILTTPVSSTSKAQTPAQNATTPPTQPNQNAPHTQPVDAKAKSLYESAVKLLRRHQYAEALDDFRSANNHDGGTCIGCESNAWSCAISAGNYKAAREEAALLIEQMTDNKNLGTAHFYMGRAWFYDAMYKHHVKSLAVAAEEYKLAIAMNPTMTECHYDLGRVLANEGQDEAARAEFKAFLDKATPKNVLYERGKRFAEHPEMARERLAPPFHVTTLDGQEISLDSLTGKVVLLDFWATWCGPCKAALPHIAELNKKYTGQPFVVLSVSMDSDEEKWRGFIAHNNMTWLQYRDGRIGGPLANLFDVNAIPATFTIDADGALQEQHVGDADIDGKIKKLIEHANDLNRKKIQN